MTANRISDDKMQDRAARGVSSLLARVNWRMPLYALVFSALALLLSGVPGARAADAVVTNLQTGISADRARFALHLDRRVAFRLFTLNNPYRVVVDLPEVGWRLPQRPLPSSVTSTQTPTTGSASVTWPHFL